MNMLVEMVPVLSNRLRRIPGSAPQRGIASCHSKEDIHEDSNL